MSKIKNYIFITIMVILAFCLYGLPTFYAPDETRYSEVAREMIANHDFIVPYVNGIIFFHKPPLVYWIVDVFMNVFGQNTWGARLANPSLVLVTSVNLFFLLGYSQRFSKRIWRFLIIQISIYEYQKVTSAFFNF